MVKNIPDFASGEKYLLDWRHLARERRPHRHLSKQAAEARGVQQACSHHRALLPE